MIRIDQPTPTRPGLYLWRSALTGSVELIRVFEQPARFEYGTDWPAYLVVAGHNGRSVSHLSGGFSMPLEMVRDDYGSFALRECCT